MTVNHCDVCGKALQDVPGGCPSWVEVATKRPDKPRVTIHLKFTSSRGENVDLCSLCLNDVMLALIKGAKS
jgi:ribosomal protein L34E